MKKDDEDGVGDNTPDNFASLDDKDDCFIDVEDLSLDEEKEERVVSNYIRDGTIASGANSLRHA